MLFGIELIKKPGTGEPLEFVPGFGADLDRVLAVAGSGDVVSGGAVRPRNQAAEVKRIAGQRGVARDRRLAGAVKLGEEGALAGNRGKGVGMIDARKNFARARVVRARFEADGALRHRRQEFVFTHDRGRVLHQPEPFQSGEPVSYTHLRAHETDSY